MDDVLDRLDNTTAFNIKFYIGTLRYDCVLNVTCDTTKGWRQLLLLGVSQPTSMNTVIRGNQIPLTSISTQRPSRLTHLDHQLGIRFSRVRHGSFGT